MTSPPINVPALRRKVAWRILPLVVVLYIVSYLDRANVAFAKLRMGEALGFSEDVFGFGIGVFFIGYLFSKFPVPCSSSDGARGNGSRAFSSHGGSSRRRWRS